MLREAKGKTYQGENLWGGMNFGAYGDKTK